MFPHSRLVYNISQPRQPHISCMYQYTFEYLRETSPSSIPPQFKLDSSLEQDRHLVMHALRILHLPWPFFGTVFREDDTDILEGWECSECAVHARPVERHLLRDDAKATCDEPQLDGAQRGRGMREHVDDELEGTWYECVLRWRARMGESDSCDEFLE